MVTTVTKPDYANFINTNPTIAAKIKSVIIDWNDKQITYDETLLTAAQLTAFQNFLTKLGYS